MPVLDSELCIFIGMLGCERVDCYCASWKTAVLLTVKKNTAGTLTTKHHSSWCLTVWTLAQSLADYIYPQVSLFYGDS